MDALTHLPECDDRREYRDDLLHVSAALLAGSEHVTNVTDKDIDTAVCIADRLIRKVDKFVSGPAQSEYTPGYSFGRAVHKFHKDDDTTTLPVPPVVLGDQDGAA